jgi:hypothetical protein
MESVGVDSDQELLKRAFKTSVHRRRKVAHEFVMKRTYFHDDFRKWIRLKVEFVSSLKVFICNAINSLLSQFMPKYFQPDELVALQTWEYSADR